MPIFGLGGKRSGRAPEARTIPADGDAELRALLEPADSRDWPALHAGLSKYSGNDLSSLIGTVCAKSPTLSDWLPEAVGKEPGDALTSAFLGAATIERAWRVRTNQRAQHVSRDQFREFHQILREAEEHLYRSAELDTQSAAPWYSLLASGRGLQVGLDVQRRRFEAVLERCPGHLGAHSQMLQQLCRKWSGSHEQMHAFATEALRGPYGDELGVLIPRAYFEHLIDLAKDSPERGFITTVEARAELQEAADRTIFRPGYRPARNPYAAANTFAWVFTAAEMWPQARAAFQATEGVVVNWCAFHNPMAAYTSRRNLAYQHKS
jgi:hypothetical protein